MLYERTGRGLQNKSNTIKTVPKIIYTSTHVLLCIKISDSECIGYFRLYSAFSGTISNPQTQHGRLLFTEFKSPQKPNAGMQLSFTWSTKWHSSSSLGCVYCHGFKLSHSSSSLTSRVLDNFTHSIQHNREHKKNKQTFERSILLICSNS